MGRIRKMKATTAAGIYAKAAVPCASRTGAADLAVSLAQDLLDRAGLRSALWPASELTTGRVPRDQRQTEFLAYLSKRRRLAGRDARLL
jgi:hypothetical protein